MTRMFITVFVGLSLTSLQAMASEGTEAADACIDQLRAIGGPDAQGGGEILSSEVSQTGTLVVLRDPDGTVWRRIPYSDGTVGEPIVIDAADDGGGAIAGPAPEYRGQLWQSGCRVVETANHGDGPAPYDVIIGTELAADVGSRPDDRILQAEFRFAGEV